MERYDEAVSYFVRLVDADPTDAEAAVQLGNVYRADNRFIEAADAYSRALGAGAGPASEDWRIYYFRGVSLERSERWPEAEGDFKKALQLNPEQPQVLNYLGYSWVDQGLNLEAGLSLIKQAVDARPNDGYIVDSLGWAYYRLGRFAEAVTALETAVALRAEDPTINDHLGDAYWQVGRKREAMFQWAHARDLKPEPEDLQLILKKLEHGLAAVGSANQAVVDPAKSVRVEKGESLWDIAVRVYGDAGQYQRILDANKDRITDPNKIYPGMELLLPAP
jgi:tetratricopeptide (TPR) repeat protein